MMRKLLKRYTFFIVMLVIAIGVTVWDLDLGAKSFSIAGSSVLQMLSVLPPIMLLLGLMDVWVPREKMMRYMGENSGLLGIFLAIVLGSVAAGPMYAAFPFTAALLRKGVKLSNIIIFLGAWCVTKIPTFMFELAALGYKFTLARLAVDLPGIIIMGYLVEWLISKDEMQKIYFNAENMDL